MSKHPNYRERKDTIPLIVALQGEILLRASRVTNEVINRCGIFMYSGLYLRSALHAMSNEFYPCVEGIARESRRLHTHWENPLKLVYCLIQFCLSLFFSFQGMLVYIFAVQ